LPTAFRRAIRLLGNPESRLFLFGLFAERNHIATPYVDGGLISKSSWMNDRSPSHSWEVSEMAQWQYKTFCTALNLSVDFDEELRKILQDYGMKGWELVQVLQPQNDTRYHLVFKTQRSLYPNLEPAKSLIAGGIGLKALRISLFLSARSSSATAT
jgi:hypothetical protein